MARGDIVVRMIGDPSSLKKGLKESEGALDKFSKKADIASKSTHRLNAAAIAFTGGLVSGAGLVAGVKVAIDAASNLHEQINKSEVVFGNASKSVLAWSKDTATSLGLAQDKAIQYAATFGNMLKPMGFATDTAAKMSTQIVNLAADMASFNNASPEETLQALQSGLAGQVRPLRQFGVFLDQNRIKQEALTLGLWSGKGALDASAKASAIYQIILKDTKDAQGDFARTSGGLANQQRILKAQISDLEAEIGTKLMPVVLKIVTHVNKWTTELLHSKKAHEDFQTALKDVKLVVDDARKSWKLLADAVGGNTGAVKLLGAAFVAWKLSSKLNAISIAAGPAGGSGAVGRLALMRLELARLAKIGIITIGIEMVMGAHTTKTGLHRYSGKAGWGNLWHDVTDAAVHALGGSTGGSGDNTAIPGRLTGFLGDSSNIGGPGGKVQGHTGQITSGLAALEAASGGSVNNDFAKSGHAKNSYHYRGEAVDLAPDAAVWARLFARKEMFAELLGPWGLYNWGVQFYDAALQKQHMDHIHIAYTGGQPAIAKAFGGPGTPITKGSTADSALDLTGDVKIDKGKGKKPRVLTGSKLLSAGLQIALAKAGGTKGSADNLAALKREEAELLAMPQSLAVVKQLAVTRKQINEIETADTAKHLAAQKALYTKHAAGVTAEIKKMSDGWKTHTAVLKKAADDAKAIFDRSFGDAESDLFKQFDRQTQMGLNALVVAQTPEEKAYADFQAKRDAQDQAKSRADALANAQTDEERTALALGFSLDDQEKALKDAADASRIAQDKATGDAQQAYQDKRDADQRALQNWLDDQKKKLDDGRETWDSFYTDLKKKASDGGWDVGAAFWESWNAAAGASGDSTRAQNIADNPGVGDQLQVIQQMAVAGQLTAAQANLFRQGHRLEIPGFAGGVDNFRGGLALVGEHGPEIVSLPGGSSVTPNGGVLVADVPIVLQVGEDQLFAVVQRVTLRNKQRNGRNGLG